MEGNVSFQLLACLARHPSAFTSTCGTDTEGRGAFEPPPEDGARTKLFYREFQFRESYTEAETEKPSDRIPAKKNDHICLYSFIIPTFAIRPCAARVFAVDLSHEHSRKEIKNSGSCIHVDRRIDRFFAWFSSAFHW